MTVLLVLYLLKDYFPNQHIEEDKTLQPVYNNVSVENQGHFQS